MRSHNLMPWVLLECSSAWQATAGLCGDVNGKKTECRLAAHARYSNRLALLRFVGGRPSPASSTCRLACYGRRPTRFRSFVL